jgi:hypothetical protein
VNSPPQTFGGRFLDALRARLQSTGGLKYAAIQLLEGADREEFGRILRRELTGLTCAANKRIEEDEPEALAEWFAQQLAEQSAAAAQASAFFIP